MLLTDDRWHARRLGVGIATILSALLTGCILGLGGSDPSVTVEATAGPVCPAEQLEQPGPPDPACEPRPVAGATMEVRAGDEDGPIVVRGVTDADGRLEMDLAPGNYVIIAGEVEGLALPSEPFAFTVQPGDVAILAIPYDTGLR